MSATCLKIWGGTHFFWMQCYCIFREEVITGKETGSGHDILVHNHTAFLLHPHTRCRYSLLRRFVLITVCICALGLLCVLWLIRRTMAPLAKLQKTTERIASGSYVERVYIHSRDEVGLLAENFNLMAVAVENHV